MNICSECDKFAICCDFCKYAKYDDGMFCGPTGCSLYPDKEHQETAKHCNYCEDYYDRYVEKE